MERHVSVTAADWEQALQELAIPRHAPIIAHASLSAFGYVEGGAETVLSALLQQFDSLLMPAFTYKTMVTPETGPPDNGLDYGAYQDANRMVQFFDPQMPVDRLMGVIPERLRLLPGAQRSSHPILSFTGVNAADILASQTLAEPLAPVGELLHAGGWVLLLGVDHSVNTSIHYAERLAGRAQFVRWALTPEKIVECPRFPGCSDGFPALAPRLGGAPRQALVGKGAIQAFSLSDLMQAVLDYLAEDPLALLCNRTYCERCEAVRSRMLKSSRAKV